MEKNMTIPRYRRIPINWELLKSRIIEEGYSLSSISKKIGIDKGALYVTNRDHKINPAIVYEISKHISLDIKAILGGFRVERVHNGRSTSGRLGTDWLYLKRECERKNYSLYSLSIALGRSPGYLSSCKREGGISEDVMIKIGEILGIDYHNLIKVTSYEKWPLRYEMVDMVNGQDLPAYSKNVSQEINRMYQGNSLLWVKLKQAMLYEVNNHLEGEVVSELVEKYRPDLINYSINDMLECIGIEYLPASWRSLAIACIRKYGLPPFSEQ